MGTYIETDRLILRDWEESDKEAYIALNADPEVRKYFPGILSSKEAVDEWNKIVAHLEEFDFSFFAAECKSDQKFIGFIGIVHCTMPVHFAPCIEIGWRLARPYWNRGLATEGASATLDYAFNNLGIAEIYSFTTISNKASENVMKKIGMRNLGTFLHPNIPEESPLCEHLLYHVGMMQ